MPPFASDTQLQLDRANTAFKETGALLNPDTKCFFVFFLKPEVTLCPTYPAGETAETLG